MTAKKKKTLTAVGAVAMAAAVGLGGTFAWQSISQQALNEAAAIVNPGGRLHDDFDGRNKDVYVENFTEAPDGTVIFARVRLDEYMELGVDAGKNQDAAKRNVDPVVPGTNIKDKNTWITRTPDATGSFSDYWKWTTGGQTIYMPTFNRDKDSLKADINGTYEGTGGTPYDDYRTYTDGQPQPGTAVYDNDADDADNGGTRTEEETHTATTTIDGTVITMDEWLIRWEAYQTAVEDGADPETAAANTQVKGDFWVWDADGWAYWANPIAPSTATGLLLDSIELINPPSDNYYFGINVVGQFVTADDVGHLNGTGFYDEEAGKLPTENAEALIELLTGQDISVTRVEISGDDSVTRGSNGSYEARVFKGNTAVEDASVEWSVDGNLQEDTSINNYGTLRVPMNESANEVTIVAAYTGADGEIIFGKKKVTLTTSEASLSISASSDDPVPPGGALELEAKVHRLTTEISADSVTWSVSGNTDDTTTIAPATGSKVTLTVGNNEARGPFTVTASFHDPERGEIKTDSIEVTADVPVPLDADLSQAIRDANIEDNPKGLDGAYEDYETVKIGNNTAYVLAVDGDRALLGLRYTSSIWFYNKNTIPQSGYNVTWAESTVRREWGPGRLNANKILGASALTTDIYTRNPGDIFEGTGIQPGVRDYATISEDGKWIITQDKMFLFTEADIRGTDYWADPAEENYDYKYIHYPTLDPKDFTYDNKPIIPRAILKKNASETFAQETVLRSPIPTTVGTREKVSLYGQRRSEDVIIDYMMKLDAIGSSGSSGYYPFAGVWVQLSPAE